MAKITVVGPLKTEDEARETARSLGEANHSVYSRYKSDEEGFVTEEKDWFVERDDSIPGLIFGQSWESIQAMQSKRAA